MKQVVGRRRSWGRISFLMSARVTHHPRIGGEWWVTADEVKPLVMSIRANVFLGDIVVSADVAVGRTNPDPPSDSSDGE